MQDPKKKNNLKINPFQIVRVVEVECERVLLIFRGNEDNMVVNVLLSLQGCVLFTLVFNSIKVALNLSLLQIRSIRVALVLCSQCALCMYDPECKSIRVDDLIAALLLITVQFISL